MSKKLLIASALLLLCWGAKAQNDQLTPTTYDGYKGSKAVVLTGLQDGLFSFISEDNRYLSGAVTGSSGFVYDFQEQKFLTFNDLVLHAFFSPDHYVASDPGENQTPFIRYNGVDHELEHTINNSTSDRDLSYWNAQPNGDRIVVMGYEWDYGFNDAGERDSATNHVGIVYDGKTGTVLTLLHSFWPRVEPLRAEENIGYGTRAYAISGDGTVVGGHGAWPTMLVISNNQTMFWDLVDLETKDTIYTYVIRDMRFSMSDLVGANRDGSVLVGYNEETHHGLIIHYDRAAKSFTFDTIAPLPGYDLLSFNTVSENGLVLGYCHVSADPGTRQAVVYSLETRQLMTLKSYLYEYYDIDIATDLGCPTNASADGKIMAGFFYDRGWTIPWFVQLGDESILPRVRNVAAKAAATGLIVRVDWQAPVASEHTLTGYEIYRNDETTPLVTLDAKALTYTDQSNITPGQNTYYVVAVYADGKADKKASNAVTVLVEGGYFPVQEIGSRVEYNRYTSIYWGLPSSEVVASAAAAVPVAKGEARIDRTPRSQSMTKAMAQPAAKNAPKYPNTALDYIYDVNMLMYNGYSGTKIGEKYYVSSWQGNSIRIIDRNGEVEKEWTPAGLNHAVLAMVYLQDEQKLYCGSLEKVYEIDMKTERVLRSFDAESRHLTYLPDFEFAGQKGVLMAGGWNTCYFYSMEGDSLGEAGFDFSDIDVSGTAYYNGKLYAASQTGYYQNEIYTFDVATRQQAGEPIQVVEDPAVYNMLSLNGEVTSTDDLAVAAGLTVCTLDDGTVALAAVYQCSYTHSRLMFLELESAPGRNGYILYRDGKQVAPMQTTRRFYEELTPGTYVYTVKAYGDGKESDFSPADTVVIANYDACLPAKDIKAREAAGWVALEWGVPTQDSAAGLIGFTVFRDGQQLNRLWNNDVALFYTDFSDLTTGTPYTYRIETLYASGCTASDSTQITLTGEGEALAPFGIRFDYKKNAASTADNKLYDVTTTWEAPMFEQPLAIGYGTGQMITGAAFEGITEYWAAIGWDATDLTLYKDLYLVGMEYMLGDDTRSFDAFVYLNDTLAFTQSLRRTQSRAWQTMYFSQSFPMAQPSELVVGYHLTHNEGAAPVCIDYSYSKPFYSDLVSFDGLAWYSLAGNKIDAAWAIRGLVVRKRDLDAATTNGHIDYQLLEGKIMRLEEPMQATLKPAKTQLMAQAPSKDAYTLQGFNLYRQRMDIDGQAEVQLNDAPLTTYSYTEKEALPEGEYDYTVEAIYANAKLSATETVILEDVSTETGLDKLQLTLYPNPASDVVYVNGEYTGVQILDLGGRVLRQMSNASQIEVGNLMPGTYFFRFTAEDGRAATYKVVIR